MSQEGPFVPLDCCRSKAHLLGLPKMQVVANQHEHDSAKQLKTTELIGTSNQVVQKAADEPVTFLP